MEFTTIVNEAMTWGMQYDIYVIEVTEKQLALANKYANQYCRNGNCKYNYACCHKCYHLKADGCNWGQVDIPVVCNVFFCSFVLKQLPKNDLEILTLFNSLLNDSS